MDRNGSPSRANTKRRAGEQYTPMRASFFTRFYRYMQAHEQTDDFIAVSYTVKQVDLNG